ncbi:MAG: cobalt-precorrin 5A hydrolase [Desulfopila sp.]
MKTCVLALTPKGHILARKMATVLPDCELIAVDGKIVDTMARLWSRYQGIICIMATGIVVRAIAPLLQNKTTDPCVVVLDQNGEHAISLVSGHLGGGNDLARLIGDRTGARPVITTASDVSGCTALDLWARRNGLQIDNRQTLTEKSAKLVARRSLQVYSPLPLVGLPRDLLRTTTADEADVVISWQRCELTTALHCIPRLLYVGVGCNRGTSVTDIERAFMELCAAHRLEPGAVAGIASIDLKNDEVGILEFAAHRGVDIQFFCRDALNGVRDVSYSRAVMRAVGVQGVAEPAAVLAAATDGSAAELLVRKMKWKDVTMAVAQRKRDRWE